MEKLPGAVFIVDPKNETIALKEANKLKIPTVAIVDTNCDPENVNYVIPGNDDAIRAIRLITSRISEACIAGRQYIEEKRQAESDKGVAMEKVKVSPEEDVEGPVVEKIRRKNIDTDTDDAE